MDLNSFENLDRYLNPAQAEKILVVDDDPRICRSLIGILADVGLNADAVHNVQDAAAALARQPYCLVLLDLNMPGGEGTELIDHINQEKIDTCVIVVSGESEFRTAIDVIKRGARDFVRKPYSPEELLVAIKNALESRNLETENRVILEELKRSEALHRFIVHNSPDLLYIIDRDGNFTFINNNVTSLLGYRKKEVIGRHFSHFVYPPDLQRARDFFTSKSYPNNGNSVELRLRHKSRDTVVHVEIRALQVEKNFTNGYRLSRKGAKATASETGFAGIYGVARDISERKRAEEIIRFQHNHDLLTGLPNRNLLQEQLSHLLCHAKRSKEKLAFLYIDIDRFKLVNDSYGQTVGDKLLTFVAENLTHCTRESDILARLGSDEFIVLLPDIKSNQDATIVAEKIVQQNLAPFKHGAQEIHASLSIGISIYPDHGNSWEELLKSADTAMCNQRLVADSTYCIYHSKLKSHNSNRIRVENLIRTAIKEDQFVAFYQPQIHLQSGAIHGLEALARIRTAENKLIMPGDFIEISEESNLICELGEVMIDKVCNDITRWQEMGLNVPVAINISAVQLSMEGFSGQFLSKIAHYGLQPDLFELEITENVIIKDLERTLANILQLTRHGVNIAIDDFGKGYSSLSYLDQLPLKTLKMDRSFMQKVTGGGVENSIIHAIVNVSRELNLNFIAEGVETPAQHDYLTRLGNCIGQGFFYSKPVPVDRLLEFLESYRLPSGRPLQVIR